MPISMPNAALSHALAQIGLDPGRQQRGSLRTLVHRLTGEPPVMAASADELARQLIGLAKERGADEIRKAAGEKS